MILQTSEYLANLQSDHYEWHLSHLQRCADVPIKSMTALFFPQREHTAIKAEQEETAWFRRLRVMLKSTIQLNWVTTLATGIDTSFPEGERQPLPFPPGAMTDNLLEMEQIR